jgi:hypothetical protein
MYICVCTCKCTYSRDDRGSNPRGVGLEQLDSTHGMIPRVRDWQKEHKKSLESGTSMYTILVNENSVSNTLLVCEISICCNCQKVSERQGPILVYGISVSDALLVYESSISSASSESEDIWDAVPAGSVTIDPILSLYIYIYIYIYKYI